MGERDAERRSRLLFEQAFTGFFFLEPDTLRVVEANTVGAAYFGYEPSQLAGIRFPDLVGDGEKILLDHKIATALRTGVGVTGALQALRKDGEAFYFGYRVSVLRVADSTTLVMMGRDLTEIEEADHRYRDIFLGSSEAILISDPDTKRIVDCNPALERLLGWSREELLHLSVEEIEPDGERPFSSFLTGSAAITAGEHADVEIPLETRHGRRVIADVRIGSSWTGGRRMLVSFLRDVTAERAAEARYRQMFLQGSDPVLIVDRTNQAVVEVNPKFMELSEYRSEDLAEPATLSRILHLESGLIGELMAISDPAPRKATLQTASGDETPVEVRVLHLGLEQTCMVTLRDLRSEVRAAELDRAMNQAQKLQSLGQMASGIAHDFNNTLMAALPWADLLRRKFPEDETVVRAADNVRRAVHRAREVTRQLLEFAQPKKPQMKEFRLNDLVRDQLRIIRPAFPPEIEIDFLDCDPVRVFGDPSQLSQVLLGLCLNARDAMPGGGRLRIDIRDMQEVELIGAGLDPGNWVALTVSDTGVGIRPEVRENIFDPFFTTKEIGKGAGLGLAVAHRVTEQHGGRILVQSKVGFGSRFVLVLPRVGSPKSDYRAHGASGEGRLSGLQILVIEDEEVVAEGLKTLLEGEGADAEAVASGSEALERLQEGAVPSFIVLDLGLPGMTGGTVYKQVRAMLPRVPILISTGYDRAAATREVGADPLSRFIQKPYDVEDLLQEFEELVR